MAIEKNERLAHGIATTELYLVLSLTTIIKITPDDPW
jgi:hypothetical protein